MIDYITNFAIEIRKKEQKTRINEGKNQRTKKYTKKEEVEIVRMKNTPRKF